MKQKDYDVREAEISVEEAELTLASARQELTSGAAQAQAKYDRTVAALRLDIAFAMQQLERERASLKLAQHAQEKGFDE
jgi:hypothetical protein